MCVQLEDYSQIRDSIQAYTSGDVKIWIGTRYTSYGLYEVIPKVGLLGLGSCPAPPPPPLPNSPDKSQPNGTGPQPLSHAGSWSVSHGATSPL